MLGILQRYALREIVAPTLLGLVIFTFLLLVAEIFQIIELLLNTSVTIFDALMLIACLSPALLTMTVPMALMLGILLGLGRLASEREITAMRTSGVNMWRVYWPIIAASSVLTRCPRTRSTNAPRK